MAGRGGEGSQGGISLDPARGCLDSGKQMEGQESCGVEIPDRIPQPFSRATVGKFQRDGDAWSGINEVISPGSRA